MGLASVPTPAQALIEFERVTVLVDFFVEAHALVVDGHIGLTRINPPHGFRSLGQWRLSAGEQASVDPSVGVRFGSSPAPNLTQPSGRLQY